MTERKNTPMREETEAPERIWAEPGMPGYMCEPSEIYTTEYVRADLAKPKVEPLVWVAHPVSGLMAEGYQINTDKNKCLYLSFAGIVIEQTEPDAQPEHFETMKELAQDDYERRVLFALGASDDPH
jgi:hypothetical protein